jgi:hypothetical protein
MKSLIFIFFCIISFNAYSADSHSYYWYSDSSSAQAACQAKYASMTNPETAHYACSSNTIAGGAICNGANAQEYITREGFYNPTSNEYFHYRGCLAANYCVAPAELQLDGSCSTVCTTGDTGEFFKVFTINQPTELTVNTLTVDENTVNACYDGCSYTSSFDHQLPQVGTSADGTKLYHKFAGEKTGATCSGGNVSPGDIANITTLQTPNNCVIDSAGKKVCAATIPADSAQCGTVQAPGALLPTKVCVNGGNPTCTQVEGFADPICSGADKNCGWKNGQYICAESDTGASKTGAPKDCIVNSEGKKACITGQEGVKAETQKATTANPDGSTTTTETTTNNVIGDGTKTTTTTTQANGDSTTTTTGDGANNGNGTAGEGEGGGDCRKYPESIGCSQYGTIPEPDTVTTQDAPGLGPGSSLDGAAWGAGSCPAPITMNLSLAGTKSFSLQPLCDFMTAVYPVVLAISWLIAGYIVVGAVRD